jgi:hypothetical protein
MSDSYTRRDGFFLGVDPGQANDYAAITVAERTVDIVEDAEKPSAYAIRHLPRFKLGTPYLEQVGMIASIFKALPARRFPPVLIADATGVGRPVVDLLRKAGLRPKAVTITGGASEGSTGDMAYSIPKRNLVSTLQVVLQSGRLKIARGLTEAENLFAELLNFKVKISASGHDSYEAWRESIHDDLVLSASLAVWFGERHGHGARFTRVDWLSRER